MQCVCVCVRCSLWPLFNSRQNNVSSEKLQAAHEITPADCTQAVQCEVEKNKQQVKEGKHQAKQKAVFLSVIEPINRVEHITLE